MIRSLKEKILWLYLQYTFVTGIYLLDPIEIYVFNMIALGTRLFKGSPISELILLRVVQTQDILSLNSISEKVGSENLGPR